MILFMFMSRDREGLGWGGGWGGSVTVNNVAPHVDVNTERWECYSVIDHTFRVLVKTRGVGGGGGGRVSQ